MDNIIVHHTGSTVTIKQARQSGEKRYFTGKPCINGHVAERLVSSNTCVACSAGRMRRWRNLHKPQINEYKKEYSKRQVSKEYSKDYWKYKKAKRELELKTKAGRPRPDICDVCKGNHHLRIVFDHCHQSGNFRGWLCDRCNKVLGLIYDDPVLLRNLAEYLERTSSVKTNNEAKKQAA